MNPLGGVDRGSARLVDLNVSVINADRSTNWIIVAVLDENGRTGLGETALNGYEHVVVACIEALWSTLKDQTVTPIDGRMLPTPGHPLGLAFAAAASALEQALWDLHGRALDQPLFTVFGGLQQSNVPLYANINRSLRTDRSPESFAAHAAKALSEGFTTVKCAPFDGIARTAVEDRETRVLLDTAYRRLGAVRDAIGPDADLLIDCHWRFDARGAVIVLKELEQFNPSWIEAPVSEHDLESWRHVRGHTSQRLAGGELLIGLEAFERFMAASGVDVIMPDVRYCGGVGVMRKIAAVAEARGVDLAPHNPAGPVATMISAQIMAALPRILLLEYPWGEVEWRAQLTIRPEAVNKGALHLASGPGWGIELNPEVARDHPQDVIRRTVDVALW